MEIEESLYIDRADDRAGLFAVADASVADALGDGGAWGEPAAGAAAPVTATVRARPGVRRKRRWLTVRDTRSRAVVTAIEVLSPSDKRPGADRERYLAKRDRVLDGRAHLVEVNLLLGGRRMPIDGLPGCGYYAVVSRRRERPRTGLWPVGLRPGDPEPPAGLQAVLHRVHDGAGFAHRIYRDG